MRRILRPCPGPTDGLPRLLATRCATVTLDQRACPLLPRIGLALGGTRLDGSAGGSWRRAMTWTSIPNTPAATADRNVAGTDRAIKELLVPSLDYRYPHMG